MEQVFANNASSTLQSDISSGALSLTVADGSRFPALGAPDYFLATLTQAATETSWEIVKVTNRTGNVFTIERAQEGTSAAAWTAGAKVEARLTAGPMTRHEESLLDAQEDITILLSEVSDLPTVAFHMVFGFGGSGG